MSLWSQKELLEATGGELRGQISTPIKGVEIDSRDVTDGDIFIAIKGDVQDGHIFVGKAFENGAGVAIVSKTDGDMQALGALLVVDDTLKAMEQLGVYARARTKAKIIAVTGSVGKTSTKDALAAGLGADGATHFSVASFNNHWGVPLTLARMPQDSKYGVFEVGMNHAGEIEELVKMVRPHIAIITTIAESHLGHFANIKEIADAKAEIFSGLEKGGTAIINQDTPFYDRLVTSARGSGVQNIIGFGEDKSFDVHLEKSVLHNTCSCISADVMGERVTFKLGSPGKHMVMNTLAVLAAMKVAGADLARGVLALAEIAPPKGRGVRLQFTTKNGNFLVIDESYNANPTSMEAALALLGRAQPMGQGRRIAVLGDMLELGENSDQLHAGLAGLIDKEKVDLVFACGPMMKNLWRVLPKFKRAFHADTSGEITMRLLAEIGAGDVVMVKGSLGSKMGPLVAAIKDHFSEAEQAA